MTMTENFMDKEPADKQASILNDRESMEQGERLYFAYGSNMDLDQMDFRCPDAKVVGNVRLEGYRLIFCSRNRDSGVATILPEKDSHVDGVLWRITGDCEKSLDRYEGYPYLYGKQEIQVKTMDGKSCSCMVYVMNSPYKDYPAVPSQFYLKGILRGCRQNGISKNPILKAVRRVKEEVMGKDAGRKKNWPER